MIDGDGGLGSSSFPRIMEEWGKYDGDSSEEVLPAIFAAVCIVAKDVITIDFDILPKSLGPTMYQHRADACRLSDIQVWRGWGDG